MFIFNPEATQMHTLVAQLTTTFVDDAIELVKGFGKVIVHIATAPIERIAMPATSAGFWPAASRRVAPARRRRPVVRAARGSARCRRLPPCII
jgi:hypothetical protein